MKNEDIVNALEVIGLTDELINEIEDLETFIIELNEHLWKSRFESNDNDDMFLRDNRIRYERGNITEEEYLKFIELYKKNENIFSDLIDYDLIQAYFIDKFQIDLDVDNIIWFDYVRKREYMLSEDNQITKRMNIRRYKPKDEKDYEYMNAMLVLKAKYSF